MSDLQKILKEEYKKKKTLVTPSLLMDMIQEALDRPDDEAPPRPQQLNEAERFSVHIPIPKLNRDEI